MSSIAIFQYLTAGTVKTSQMKMVTYITAKQLNNKLTSRIAELAHKPVVTCMIKLQLLW